MRGLILPTPLQRRLERIASELMRPRGGLPLDLTQPKGEPALLPPDSLSWLVFKNPMAVAIGGVAAVILELAEPRVRTGVWAFTSFRTAPLQRIQRTGMAAMMTVYGPRGQAEAMIGRVRHLHSHVHGQTPQGVSFNANDPELLDWVQATAVFGFAEAYSAYVSPLSPAEKDQFYAEGLVSARLYGADNAPASTQAMAALFSRMQPLLEPSPIVFEFIDIVRHAPLLPRGFMPLQRLMVKAAIDIVPPWARERLGIGPAWRLNAWERTVLTWAARTVDHLILRDGPAVQACLRMGLPQDHLYRSAR